MPYKEKNSLLVMVYFMSRSALAETGTLYSDDVIIMAACIYYCFILFVYPSLFIDGAYLVVNLFTFQFPV